MLPIAEDISVCRVFKLKDENPVFIGSAFFVTDVDLISAKHLFVETDCRYAVTGRAFSGMELVSVRRSDDRDVAILHLNEPLPGALFLSISYDDVAIGTNLRICGFSSSTDAMDSPPATVHSRDGLYDAIAVTPHFASGLSGGPALRGNDVVGVAFARNSDRVRGYIVPLRAVEEFISHSLRGKRRDLRERFPHTWSQTLSSRNRFVALITLLVIIYPTLYWSINHSMHLLYGITYSQQLNEHKELRGGTYFDNYMWIAQFVFLSVVIVPIAWFVERRSKRFNNFHANYFLSLVFVAWPAIAMIILGIIRGRQSSSAMIFAALHGASLTTLLHIGIPTTRERILNMIHEGKTILTDPEVRILSTIKANLFIYLIVMTILIIFAWLCVFFTIIIVLQNPISVYNGHPSEISIYAILWPCAVIADALELMFLGLFPALSTRNFASEILELHNFAGSRHTNR